MAAVVGGVGVVAIGAGGYFFFDGKSDVSHLRDSCAPGCQESDVDRARTKIRVADVLLGTGIIALGVATFLALDSGGDERHARAPTTAIVF